MLRYNLSGKSSQQSFIIYARCVLRTNDHFRKNERRSIGTKYLAKVGEAERQWKEQGKLIRDGEKKSMLAILEERGFVHQIAGYGTASSIYGSLLT
jgi:tyrosyl-tRNA synthetase